MRRMSLQWRITCITALCIAVICGCLTMFVYQNGVYYIDSLQDAVESQGDDDGNESDAIYTVMIQVSLHCSDILFIVQTPPVFYIPLPPCLKSDHIQVQP